MSTNTEGSQDRVTAQDIAKRYKVSPRAVLHWKDKGLIPHIKIGKTVRFDMQAVVAAIEGKPQPVE